MASPPESLLATERRNPHSVAIDSYDALQLADLFAAEDTATLTAVAAQRASIAAAIDLVEAAFRRGGRLIYVGAGTSGRLGVLDASECPPTFGTPPEMVQGIIAGGPAALVRSVEGAEDDHEAGAVAIDEKRIGAQDVVFGIAASGSTPYVHGALQRARALQATTILLTCAVPRLGADATTDLRIQLDVGPELITGSTRLKAGTATKMVLNTVTSGAMIRLGKTYGNLMVDLQASNAKLRDRGERIVMEVLGVGREVARDALARAHGKVRTAIVMLHGQLGYDDAERALVAVDGRLRAILGPPPAIKESR